MSDNKMDILGRKLLATNYYEVGMSVYVDVIHVDNPHHFYVRPKTWSKYLAIIEHPGSKLDPSQIHIDKHVIYKSKIQNNFIRGQIVYIKEEENKYDIIAIDYGHIEIDVCGTRIFEQPTDLAAPPLLLKCHLRDCMPLKHEEWCHRTIKTMKQYLHNVSAVMKICARLQDKFIVEMSTSHMGDLATILALGGYSLIGYGMETISRITTLKPLHLYYKHKVLSENTVLHVRLLSIESPLQFYVAEINEYRQSLLETNELNTLLEREKVIQEYDLKVGMPVAVESRVNTSYRRAVVIDVAKSSNKTKLQLVDWGYYRVGDFQRLKPLRHEKYFEKPAVAIYCSIDSDKLSNERLLSYLYVDNEFLITVKKPGKGFDVANIVDLSPI